ncbi:DUF5017 domain-containing protein [Pedobacter sp. UBA4863]|uniref:DUF5017 domain-containing protein n=1 Tax=Pedobacter sp. UBA4863 TaxID=1947060 RepID=UPI0025E873C0|nr:DUF5017 domain-containing protein [Pedobacter sp. UBA4863]
MKILYSLLLAAVFMGCEKEYEVKEPSLKINLDKQTYKVGDTITFDFDGDADFITFYSGTKLNDYQFAHKERIYDAEMLLSFRFAKYSGANADVAQLKYSTNYNGAGTIAAVQAATWNDFPPGAFNYPISIGVSAADAVHSGNFNINSLFVDENTPVSFCWFFNTPAGVQRTQAYIEGFKVFGNVTSDPTLSGDIYTFGDMGFKVLYDANQFTDSGTSLPNVNATRVLWTGVYVNTIDKEGYAVTVPILRKNTVNLGIDKPIVVKSVSDPESSSYRYVYATPGTYKAAFVIANRSVYGRKEVVKEIEINIEP